MRKLYFGDAVIRLRNAGFVVQHEKNRIYARGPKVEQFFVFELQGAGWYNADAIDNAIKEL